LISLLDISRRIWQQRNHVGESKQPSRDCNVEIKTD
jgi:hypothetical protein